MHGPANPKCRIQSWSRPQHSSRETKKNYARSKLGESAATWSTFEVSTSQIQVQNVTATTVNQCTSFAEL